jgi:hypothetical protein
MKFIRIFLWVLVAAMSLQGYLHADEYGTATSLMGGISLSMLIWKESLLSSVQSLWATPTHIPLPRAFVVAAIRETTRHPGLHTLPPLRRSLAEHMRRWDAFRDMEVRWMLRHTDLVGALATEGRDTWARWNYEENEAKAIIDRNYRAHCRILPSTQCIERNHIIAIAEERLANATNATNAWERALRMDPALPLLSWWIAIQGVAHMNFNNMTDKFYRDLQSLHDVTWPSDSRVRARESDTRVIAELVLGDIWIRRFVESLLKRDLWATCLEHLRRRETRIHELMVAAGVQDMINTHERILNASLRAIDQPGQLVQDWFAEAYGYAWWMPDEIPTIVRRCIKHMVGDCTRIGPTEIVSLSAQFDERVRIIGDWTRRIFLGLWNALPALALLFVLELIVLIVPQRRVYTYLEEDPIREIQESMRLRDGRST